MTDTKALHFKNVSRETFTAYMYAGDDYITLQALNYDFEPVEEMIEIVQDSDKNSMNWFENGTLEKVMKEKYDLELLTNEALYEIIEEENPEYDSVELSEIYWEAFEN